MRNKKSSLQVIQGNIFKQRKNRKKNKIQKRKDIQPRYVSYEVSPEFNMPEFNVSSLNYLSLSVKRSNFPALFFLLLLIGSAAGRTYLEPPHKDIHDAAMTNNVDRINLFVAAGIDVNLKDSEGGTPLHFAADNGHVESINELLNLKADINAKDNEGNTPLYFAVDKQHEKAIERLIQQGADVNAKNDKGFTPLLIAAGSQRVDIGELLLKFGANVDVQNQDGDTPLHEAVLQGQLKFVQLLLGAGANIHIKNAHGITPIHGAAFSGKVEILRKLVKAGANLETKTNLGRTLLHLASISNKIEMAKELIKLGVDIEAKDIDGNTAYHIAMFHDYQTLAKFLKEGMENKRGFIPLHSAAGRGDVDAIKLLVRKGIDVHTKNHEGLTPLHIAVSKLQDEAVDELLSLGADINIKGDKGRSPLHLALLTDSLKALENLLRKGTPVNAEDNEGNMPLQAVADKRQVKTVERLIQRGADLNAKDDNGFTPLHIAAELQLVDIGQLLLKFGANVDVQDTDGDTPLHRAIVRGQLKFVQLLLEAGANIHIRNSIGAAPVHRAAFYGEVEILRELVKAGANLEAKTNVERTPLHLAALSNNVDVAKELIKLGADMEAKDFEGNTAYHIAMAEHHDELAEILKEALERSKEPMPLHKAAERGDVDTIKLLVHKGMDVNTKDQYGFTPLHYAIGKLQNGTVDELLSLGADVNIKCNKGLSPLHVAVSTKNFDALKRLLRAGAAINVRDAKEASPLHYAVSRTDVKFVEELIKWGAKIDEEAGEKGYTPLYAGVVIEKPEIVSMLIKWGANPVTKDEQGRTPYSMAKLIGHQDIIKALEERITHAKDGPEYIPLVNAVEEEDVDRVKYLIKLGVNIDEKDSRGRTAYDLAKAKGFHQIANILEEEAEKKSKQTKMTALAAGGALLTGFVGVKVYRKHKEKKKIKIQQQQYIEALGKITKDFIDVAWQVSSSHVYKLCLPNENVKFSSWTVSPTLFSKLLKELFESLSLTPQIQGGWMLVDVPAEFNFNDRGVAQKINTLKSKMMGASLEFKKLQKEKEEEEIDAKKKLQLEQQKIMAAKIDAKIVEVTHAMNEAEKYAKTISEIPTSQTHAQVQKFSNNIIKYCEAKKHNPPRDIRELENISQMLAEMRTKLEKAVVHAKIDINTTPATPITPIAKSEDKEEAIEEFVVDEHLEESEEENESAIADQTSKQEVSESTTVTSSLNKQGAPVAGFVFITNAPVEAMRKQGLFASGKEEVASHESRESAEQKWERITMERLLHYATDISAHLKDIKHYEFRMQFEDVIFRHTLAYRFSRFFLCLWEMQKKAPSKLTGENNPSLWRHMFAHLPTVSEVNQLVLFATEFQESFLSALLKIKKELTVDKILAFFEESNFSKSDLYVTLREHWDLRELEDPRDKTTSLMDCQNNLEEALKDFNAIAKPIDSTETFAKHIERRDSLKMLLAIMGDCCVLLREKFKSECKDFLKSEIIKKLINVRNRVFHDVEKDIDNVELYWFIKHEDDIHEACKKLRKNDFLSPALRK